MENGEPLPCPPQAFPDFLLCPAGTSPGHLGTPRPWPGQAGLRATTGPASAPYLFGWLLSSLLLGEELQMELFLLLLVIFLQLGGGRRGSALPEAAAAEPRATPARWWLGSCRQEWGAFLGQWGPEPGRETSAERGSVSGQGRGKLQPAPPSPPCLWVGPLNMAGC